MYMVEYWIWEKKNLKNNVLLFIVFICKVGDFLDKYEFSGFKCIWMYWIYVCINYKIIY